ncbi:hypothetical protein ACYPKM_02565 [Pseudomonas aeruginosa]
MSFSCLLMHPSKPSVFMHGYPSIADAEDMGIWKSNQGEGYQFVMARTGHQLLMATGKRYMLKFNRGLGRFRYFVEHTDVSFPFDYHQVTQDGVTEFVVTHETLIPELGIKANTKLKLRWQAAWAGQFLDMFASHNPVSIEFKDGKAYLIAYHPSSHAQLGAVELKVVGTV